MANCNDKLEHRSAKVKFPPQGKLSAPNSDLQCTIEVANPCDTVVNTAVNTTVSPVPANQHQTPPPETDPAALHAHQLWRFRLALALYTGAFPNSMRLQPCSVRYVSYQQLLKAYESRPSRRRT